MSISLLVVDDHEVIRTGLASLLAGTGIEIVAQAANGKQAVEQAQQRRIKAAEQESKHKSRGANMTEFKTMSLRRFVISGVVGTRGPQQQEVRDTYLGNKIDQLIRVVSDKKPTAVLG